MEKIDLDDVLRLARMSEEDLHLLVAGLEYYPSDAPAHASLPHDLMLLDIAINLRSGCSSPTGPNCARRPIWSTKSRPPA